MVDFTTVTGPGVKGFDEAEVVELKGLQGIILASAVGVGLFVDDLDVVVGLVERAAHFRVGVPVDGGVHLAIEVLVLFFHCHCNNPPKVC